MQKKTFKIRGQEIVLFSATFLGVVEETLAHLFLLLATLPVPPRSVLPPMWSPEDIRRRADGWTLEGDARQVQNGGGRGVRGGGERGVKGREEEE